MTNDDVGDSLKIGILRCMKKLVKLLRVELELSEDLLRTFLAPIEFTFQGVSMKSPMKNSTESLEKDALLLWEELILTTENFERPNKQPLLLIFPTLELFTLQRDNEHVALCMKLVDLYLVKMHQACPLHSFRENNNGLHPSISEADPALWMGKMTLGEIGPFRMGSTLPLPPNPNPNPNPILQPMWGALDPLRLAKSALELVYRVLYHEAPQMEDKDPVPSPNRIRSSADFVATCEVLETLVLLFSKEMLHASCQSLFLHLWQFLLYQIVHWTQLDEVQAQYVSYSMMAMYKLFLVDELFVDFFFQASKKNLLEHVFEATLLQLESVRHEAEVAKSCCLGLALLLLKCDEALLSKYYVRYLVIFQKVLEIEAEASEDYHKMLAVCVFVSFSINYLLEKRG
jgi:hypothetical protein